MSLIYSLIMKRRKSHELEPLPRSAFFIIGVLAMVLVGLVLVGGRFYLANWRGNTVFLPVALFLGLLLFVAVIIRFFKKN
jgi:hypothetical protein